MNAYHNNVNVAVGSVGCVVVSVGVGVAMSRIVATEKPQQRIQDQQSPHPSYRQIHNYFFLLLF